MAINSRVATLLRQSALAFQGRARPFRGSFPLVLLSLLLGFLLANVFGTILNLLRAKLAWDGFVLLGVVLLVEATSCLTYCDPLCRVSLERGASLGPLANAMTSWRIVNSFKIGLLLGFFVDAFKVGS